jgi:hypothetical protein
MAAVMFVLFEDTGAGGGSWGITIQQTMYAIMPGIGGKIAANSQRMRTRVTSASK